MDLARPTAEDTSRVARHRKKIASSGSRRVEVTVPVRDAPLVKAIAGALRSGGDDARRVREALQPLVPFPTARTGRDLIAFLRASPLVEAELQIERDQSTGRSIGLD